MIYEIVEYGLLVALSLYLIHYYASNQVSVHVKLWSIITWVLTFALALLVPNDIYLTLTKKGSSSDSISLGHQYVFLYWTVYILTWTIIPVLQEWQDSGDLQSKDRLKRSLRNNGLFYLWMLLGAIVGLVALILVGAGGEMGLITFLKCLATIWGIFLLMVLLGYSLVQIPRVMWRNSQIPTYLSYLYQKIHQLQAQLDQSATNFKQIYSYIQHISQSPQSQQIQQYCEYSLSLIPPQMKHLTTRSYIRVLQQSQYFKDYPVCLQSSIEHNRLMKRSINLWRRCDGLLKRYVRTAIFYEDVLRAKETSCKVQSRVKKVGAIEQWWYLKARNKSLKIVSYVVGTASALLLLSETQFFLTGKSSVLSSILLFHNIQIIRFVSLLLIGFIAYMSYYGLFRLRLANMYGLYYKQSDGPSLMFATVNFSRVGVAIAINFLDMLDMQNSIFSHVLQTPQMGLLGEWVIKGLPGVLWIIALSHYFNLWDRISKFLGLDTQMSFASHEITSGSLAYPSIVERTRSELEESHSNLLMARQSQISTF